METLHEIEQQMKTEGYPSCPYCGSIWTVHSKLDKYIYHDGEEGSYKCGGYNCYMKPAFHGPKDIS